MMEDEGFDLHFPRISHFYNPNGLAPTPIRVHSQGHGFSPGLKNMPLACFLPRFARPSSSNPESDAKKSPTA